VLGFGASNYQLPDAKRVMEKFLEQYKQIDAVLSANDSMAARRVGGTEGRQPLRRA